ncbi:MAG: hypothetical protein GF401_15625 [Chitinivibrionales bacterium]|nr:hypothetical protein [Chitinivibrionales bacterium]
MPRMNRLEFPGSLVHIMSRGIDGRRIFNNDNDRLKFLYLFARYQKNCGYRCLAWCLMNNHYHFLLRTNENPMSKLMRPLNGVYAQWFNNKEERNGYLFQNRFKSVLCQDQEYALHLIRYIHLNPLRAGLVSSLEELAAWKWSGHRYLLGLNGAIGRDFQHRKEALRRFGRTEKAAIKKYMIYLNEAVDPDKICNSGALSPEDSVEFDGSKKGWPAVIGDPEFVRNAMASHAIGNLRRHRQADYAEVLSKTANEVCRKYSLTIQELMSRSRLSTRSEARAYFCYKVRHDELLPYTAIASFLKITVPSAMSLYKRWKNSQP